MVGSLPVSQRVPGPCAATIFVESGHRSLTVAPLCFCVVLVIIPVPLTWLYIPEDRNPLFVMCLASTSSPWGTHCCTSLSSWSLFSCSWLPRSQAKDWTWAITSHLLGPWRVRSWHTRLTHSYLSKREDQPECVGCTCPLTAQHIMIDFVDFAHFRSRVFSDVRTMDGLFDSVTPSTVLLVCNGYWTFLQDAYLKLWLGLCLHLNIVFFSGRFYLDPTCFGTTCIWPLLLVLMCRQLI